MPSNPRAPLASPGGEISIGGDESLARVLGQAIERSAEDHDTLTHGFHSYPARMHPDIAGTLLDAFAKEGQTMLDPFCGGGTTLVEASVRGIRAAGADLNPLALKLSRVKTQQRNAESRKHFVEMARAVAVASEERVRERVKTLAQLPREELAWYEPHTLKELAGLWELVNEVDEGPDREALQMVFSAIVVKFSKQRADTAHERVDRRIRKGLPTEFFFRKAEELAERWEEFDRALQGRTPSLRFQQCDVRDLPNHVPSMWHADLVITSPPYGGTYDYVDHHLRRFAWFGYDSREFEMREVGARRNISQEHDGARRWDAEFSAALNAIARCVKPNGYIILWMGDGVSRGELIAADEQVERVAERAQVTPLAIASQARPSWNRGPSKQEHLMLLQKR